MGKRDKPHSPVHLDSGGVYVSPGELAAILHGADSVIHRGGRIQLVKLLKPGKKAHNPFDFHAHQKKLISSP